jgi:hypothetical protein
MQQTIRSLFGRTTTYHIHTKDDGGKIVLAFASTILLFTFLFGGYVTGTFMLSISLLLCPPERCRMATLRA